MNQTAASPGMTGSFPIQPIRRSRLQASFRTELPERFRYSALWSKADHSDSKSTLSAKLRWASRSAYLFRGSAARSAESPCCPAAWLAWLAEWRFRPEALRKMGQNFVPQLRRLSTLPAHSARRPRFRTALPEKEEM